MYYNLIVNPGDKPTEMQCDLCGGIYDTSPFANMLGNGELAYSSINVHEHKYNLCPKCSYKLHNWLQENKNTNLGKIIPMMERRKR